MYGGILLFPYIDFEEHLVEEPRRGKKRPLDLNVRVVGGDIAWMPEGLNILDMEEDFKIQKQHQARLRNLPAAREALKEKQDQRLFYLRAGALPYLPLWSAHGEDTAHVRLYASPPKGSMRPGGPVSDNKIRQVFFLCEGNPFLLVHGSALTFSELKCASFSDLCSQEDSVMHLLDFINRHVGLCYLSFSFAPSQWTLYQFLTFLRQLLNCLSWFPATRKTLFLRLPDTWVQDEDTDRLCARCRGNLPYFVSLDVMFTCVYNEKLKALMTTCLETFLGRLLEKR